MYLSKIKSALSGVMAKTVDSSGKPERSLLQHTDDVIKQMAQFISLYNNELMQINKINLTRILMYGALMHDFGKIHPKFQDMLRTGKKFGHRHEILSLGFIEFLEVPHEEKPFLAAAIALHHKGWSDITERSPSYYIPNIPVEEIKTIHELVKGVEQHHVQGLFLLLQNAEQHFFSLTGKKISPYLTKNTSLSQAGIYNNMCAIQELINSFIYGKGLRRNINRSVCHQATIIRGLILSSDHLASVKPIELEQGFGSSVEVLKGLKRIHKSLYTHQKKLCDSDGSQLLIAPTGSGKTEAALLWAGSIREKKSTRGRVFFLLPYRASINAMAIRLQKEFGETTTSTVHGKTLVQCYISLMERGYSPSEAQKVARYQESLSRLNTSPIRICTPYQIIRTFFIPKSYEALLCSMLGSQLVFDEIHAYDTEVTAMTLVAAKFLKQYMAAECLFMSASMPRHLKEILQREFPIEGIVEHPNDFLKPRHRLQLFNNSIMNSEAVEHIVKASGQGSVLVVTNRVSRAIALFNKLRKAGLTDITLIHGRFSPKDRSSKEKELAPRPGKVLVATQVVEVSLDIDYDTIFTELAPLESLLQRFGRVNRKGHKETPGLVNVYTVFENEYAPFRPYNKEHLEQVLTVLQEYIRKNPSGVLNENNMQELLDVSYPPSLKQELSLQLAQKMEDFERHFVQEVLPLGVMEKSNVNSLREAWDNLFDGREVLPDIYMEEANRAHSPLDVANLMVTLSNKQLQILKKEKRVLWDERLRQYITNCEYSYDYGLLI